MKGGNFIQESRLFQIVYYLLDKGHATAPELAEKFEVSIRTIYRDVDALSGAGIPVYSETGRNGGIHLLHDFTLDKVVLSEKEKQEILGALQSLPRISNPCEENTLSKLSSLFHVHIRFGPNRRVDSLRERLPKILKAVFQQNTQKTEKPIVTSGLQFNTKQTSL